MAAKASAKGKSPEQVEAELLLATWMTHSDLFSVKLNIVGQYRDEGGEVHEVELGTIPGSLRQFNAKPGKSGSFGFNISGKVSDLSPAGITGKGFQMSGNLVAVKSNTWLPPE